MYRPSHFVRGFIVLIAFVQFVLGIVFVFAPNTFAAVSGLATAPAWTDWILVMFGARALGFSYGMMVALRYLRRHASWLVAMAVVQAIDWVGTIFALMDHKVTFAQVSTASFLPVVFVAVLIAELSRQRTSGGIAESRR